MTARRCPRCTSSTSGLANDLCVGCADYVERMLREWPNNVRPATRYSPIAQALPPTPVEPRLTDELFKRTYGETAIKARRVAIERLAAMTVTGPPDPLMPLEDLDRFVAN